MQTISVDDVRPVVVGHGENRYTMTDYLGRFNAEADGPQAYLVRQESPELRAHFHEVDQFQVVLAGDGTLGADRARRGVLHYTDAFTAYGPIRTDPAVGLAYFTLRATPTTGINYMPEERARRAAAGGGGEHFTCAMPRDLDARPAELARTRRGASAHGASLPPGARLDAAALPAQGEGFAVVLTGAVAVGGRRLPAGSLAHFASPQDLDGLAASERSDLAVLVFAPC